MKLKERFRINLAKRDVREIQVQLNKIEFEATLKNFELSNLADEKVKLQERLVKYEAILSKLESKQL